MTAGSLRVGPGEGRRIWLMRVAFVVVALGAWEALSASGLLFRDVVPSLAAIGRALAKVLSSPDFYANLGVTAQEIGVAVVIGGLAGLAVAITLGAAAGAVILLPLSALGGISDRAGTMGYEWSTRLAY